MAKFFVFFFNPKSNVSSLSQKGTKSLKTCPVFRYVQNNIIFGFVEQETLIFLDVYFKEISLSIYLHGDTFVA